MDMASIVSSLGLNEATCENNTSLVILLSVVTSNLRNVRVSGVVWGEVGVGEWGYEWWEVG